MRRFIIERDIPDIGSAEREQLRAAAGQSNSVLRAMQSEGKAIQWEHSYVAGDKTFCVYVCDEPGADRRARRAQRVPGDGGHRGRQDHRSHHREGLAPKDAGMARIDFGDGEGLERIRMWSLQPDVGMAMGAAAKTLYTKISLDVRVREIARMRVAQINRCHI